MAKRKRKASSGRKRRSGRRRLNPPTAYNRPRRRARAGHRRNYVRSRARRRRNPPAFLSMGRGVMGRVIQGVQDALVVTGGEIVANVVTAQIPAFLTEDKPAADGTATKVETQTGMIVRKLLGAAAVAIGAEMIFRGRRDVQRFAVAGALSTTVKSTIRPLLPKTGPFAGALSAGGRVVRFSAYPGLGAGNFADYPRRALPARTGMRGYPRNAPTMGAQNGGPDPYPHYMYGS